MRSTSSIFLEKATTYFPTGSGDTTLDYIENLLYLVFAIAAALVWSIADRKRLNYRRLFKVADLGKPDGTPKRCYCHTFRDTFAVEMMLAGVPIDQVSILLGHSSVRITEKHYSP